MKTLILAVTAAVLITTLALVSIFRFTVADYANSSISYVDTTDEGNNIAQSPSSSLHKEDTQLVEKPEKKEPDLSKKFHSMNQSLFGLSAFQCTPLAAGEPTNCMASKWKDTFYIGGVKIAAHCHCTLPEGSK